MRKEWIIMTAIAGAVGCAVHGEEIPTTAADGGTGPESGREPGLYANLKTAKGEIVCRLYYKIAPLTVANFVGLAEGRLKNSAKAEGKPYYDGLIFHRVIEDFMIQGGDPTGTGRGGPGYKFPDEIHADRRHDAPGRLSMANAGPDTNGSQFFITHKATPWLDGKHTVFGEVVEGMNVVHAIRTGDKIESVTIKRVGADAANFTPDQEMFDALLREKQSVKENALEAKQTAALNRIKERFPDARTTESGLMYVIQTEGEGEKPAKGATVAVHYTGKLLDGTVFDSSHRRNEPLRFPVGAGRVIPGWDEGILMMNTGGRRTLIIPPKLGYGSRGAGNVIPPNAWLIFDVELVAVQ